MLNKKAIAAFAAGTTLVSGLVIAAPSIANAEGTGSSQGQQKQQPSFHDKFEANKAYVYALQGKGPDGKPKTYTEQELKDLKTIATSKDPVATKKQIEDQKTPEEKRSEAFQAKLLANKAYINALNGKDPDGNPRTYTEQELKDLKTAANNQQKESEKVAKKADDEVKAALIAEAERFGLPKSVVDALKDYAKSKDSDAVAKLLEQGKKAAIEELAKKADAEGLQFVAKLIRNSKKSTLTALKNMLKEAEKAKRHTNNAVAPLVNNVPAYNGADLFKGLTYDQAKALYEEMNANAEAAKKDAKDGKLDADTVKLLAQAKAAFQKIVKAEIEKIAQQAEKEGFNFVAKLIRKAKTVEGARALLAEAEKGKKLTPKPINPLTPVPSQPSGNGTGTGSGTGNTNNNKTTKNDANVASPLAKTGAAVALAAAAASVLAGVGAALRKIRH